MTRHRARTPRADKPLPVQRERTDRKAALDRLRAYLDEVDEQTRRPGEPPLREAVAEQARDRLAELDRAEVAP